MKKRIFAAIDISEAARLKAAEYVRNLRSNFANVRAGWDKPEKFHLTLKFLGEVNEAQLKNFQEAVSETARQMVSFKLRIAGTGVFPSLKQARVLWLGLQDESKSLQSTNQILENECEKRGFARETRAFKPHLTIARLKENAAELTKRHLNQNFEPIEFEVSEIVIFRSELQTIGSVYTVVSKYELTG